MGVTNWAVLEFTEPKAMSNITPRRILAACESACEPDSSISDLATA
jgi:hypothetical protein